MMTDRTITLDRQQAGWILLGLIAACAVCFALAAAFLPEAVDWHGAFVPAVHDFLRGKSPYTGDIGFFNPPWTLLPLLPFTGDETAGRAALFILSLGVYGFVAVRLGASPLSLALFLTSPPMVHTLLDGNLEWLVLLGVVLPPRWGLFLVLVKPQVGIGIAVWWTVEAWHDGGWRAVLNLAAPVGLVTLLSFIPYGFWPLAALDAPTYTWNASFWPWSIPAGLALLAWGVWKRESKPALAAAPFLAPYVIFHSWLGVLAALVRCTWALALVLAALWAIVLLALV